MIWRSISGARFLALAAMACATTTCLAQADHHQQHLPTITSDQQQVAANSSTSPVDQSNVSSSSREAVIHTSSAAGEIHIMEPKEWYSGDNVVNVSTIQQRPNYTSDHRPIYTSSSLPDNPPPLPTTGAFNINNNNNDSDQQQEPPTSYSDYPEQQYQQQQQFNSSSVLDEIVNKLLASDNPLNLNDANEVSVITSSPPPSYVQVISITSPAPQPESNFDSLTNPDHVDDDSYQRDQIDRHIQYDMTPQQQVDHSPDTISSTSQFHSSGKGEQRQKLHPRQVSPNEGEERLSNYKLDSDNNNDDKSSSPNSISNSSSSSEAQNQTQSFALNVLPATDSAPVKTTSSQQVSEQRQQTQKRNLTEPEVAIGSNPQAANEVVLGSSTQEMPTAMTTAAIAVTGGGGGGRTGGVQARSMSSMPMGPSSAKGQHTRPPYASYDQFHQRADVAAAAAAATGSAGAAVALGSGRNNPQALDYEMPGVNLTVSPGGVNSTSGSAAQEVLGALNRISGQLASEAARNLRSKQPDDRERHQMSIADNSKLSELASINQLVDLNPIPIPPGSNLINSGDQLPQSENGVNRFYFSKENQLFNFYAPQLLNHRGPSDRYSGSSASDVHESLASEVPRTSASNLNANYLDSPTINSNHHNQQRRRTGEEAPPVVDYPTYYTANSDQDQQQQQQQQQQHSRSNSPTSGLLHQNNQQGSNKHYAASLINVTAPMIPPLSATEAMEADQTYKNLMHHVSGFIRPQAAPGGGGGVVAGSGGDKLRQSIYFMPTSSMAESQLQSIYSQPANQYSTKPPTAEQQLDLIANNTASYLEERMRLDRTNNYMLAGRKPNPTGAYVAPNSLNLTQTHQASGFRSPLLGSTGGSSSSSTSGGWASTRQPVPTSYLNLPSALQAAFAGHSGALNLPSSYSEVQQHFSTTPTSAESATITSLTNTSSLSRPPVSSPSPYPGSTTGSNQNSTTNPATVVTSSSLLTPTGSPASSAQQQQQLDSTGLSKRVNLTRVEHISAECSNDLIRTVIIFNGTFKGIIYSSGYVRDPSCLYINGTGKTKYDFSIRMNQCGTLGTQKVHPSAGPNEVRRRDQLMWNTLSIQYNPIIEQEWDEHFRVSCEYGSDFWKTISFSPFNVETNTGSPVLFTVNPPQCQMEILRGHGMVGPRQEAVSGPVTVGDPLTLLIHMKSEKAGYDILVKNCIAHNGGAQKMQLIDNNGCVVNERFISPFRGTYNDNDMKHVTLYSYLKAFRFTGSPILYLECEIHMCQSSCPPQMCYWRRLSKRSANETHLLDGATYEPPPADQLLAEGEEPAQIITTTTSFFPGDAEDQQQQSTSTKIISSQHSGRGNRTGKRRLRNLDFGPDEEEEAAAGGAGKRPAGRQRGQQQQQQRGTKLTTPAPPGSISDRVSLFQALEVRQEHDPEVASYSTVGGGNGGADLQSSEELFSGNGNSLMCYRRAEVLAFLFTAGSVFLVAISVTIGCCLRAVNLRRQRQGKQLALDTSLHSSANHLSSSRSSSSGSSSCSASPLSHGSSSSSSSSSLCSISNRSAINNNNNNHLHHNHRHSNNNQVDAIYHQHSPAPAAAAAPSSRLNALSAMVPILQHHSTRHKVRPY